MVAIFILNLTKEVYLSILYLSCCEAGLAPVEHGDNQQSARYSYIFRVMRTWVEPPTSGTQDLS